MHSLTFNDEEFVDNHANQIADWYDEVFQEFVETQTFNKLTRTQQEHGLFMISVFYDYCYGYCLQGPSQIDEMTIHEVCLDVMPRKVSAEKESFEAFAPTIVAFLSWCEQEGYLSNTSSTQNCIAGIGPEMVEQSQDNRNWGLAKSLFFGGSSQGFDMSDEDEIQQFMTHYNQSSLEDDQHSFLNYPSVTVIPFERQGEKIGRNDKCPCGSGKKFKKCCVGVTD